MVFNVVALFSWCYVTQNNPDKFPFLILGCLCFYRAPDPLTFYSQFIQLVIAITLVNEIVGGIVMVHLLAARKRELENELRERVQAFFEAHNETPESVSISMKMSDSDPHEGLSTIRIHIKDALSNASLNDDFTLSKISDVTTL